jgi:hypothetical protein
MLIAGGRALSKEDAMKFECDWCAITYPVEVTQCCASCENEMCETCLETHECIPVEEASRG